MNILLIGATGFIGPHVVRELVRQGHDLTVFHRGVSQSPLPKSVRRITGDRNDLASHRDELRRLAPDVVLDLILSSERQAKQLIDAIRGVPARVVVLSSADVYRACGILHGLEPGPIQPMPLTEDSELRSRLQVYPPDVIRQLQTVFTWLDGEYDKIPVERAIMGDRDLQGTALRLPMVYGPGDPLHRLFPYLKRMDDGRPAVLIEEGAARWRGPRGYVENVAAAIARATVSGTAAGRIYNIAEPESFSEMEWVQKIARSAKWKEKFSCEKAGARTNARGENFMTKTTFRLAPAMLGVFGLLTFGQTASEKMSFFITSVGSGNGANLGGLTGADQHCQALAKAVGAGNRTWRAYLSADASGNQAAVNARDRIGNGPWYNAKGVMVAKDVNDLHGDSNNLKKDTSITEKGEVVNGRGDTPNQHDILTGSQPDGKAFTDGADHTCKNWTSAGEGSAELGHHDRQGGGTHPTSWNSAHGSKGCSQDNLVSTGGFGRFYCFAIN